MELRLMELRLMEFRLMEFRLTELRLMGLRLMGLRLIELRRAPCWPGLKQHPSIAGSQARGPATCLSQARCRGLCRPKIET